MPFVNIERHARACMFAFRSQGINVLHEMMQRLWNEEKRKGRLLATKRTKSKKN